MLLSYRKLFVYLYIYILMKYGESAPVGRDIFMAWKK